MSAGAAGRTVEDVLALLAPFDGLSPDLVREYVLVGEELRFPAGAKLIDQGEPGLGLDVLLEGRIEFWSRTGDRDAHYDVFEAPIYYGHEPLLADMPAPVSGRFVEDSRLYRIPPDLFWRMLGACPTILRALVGTLAQRFQDLGSASQQSARLTSVSTMAAGLAHELNNPASSALRGARELATQLAGLADAALRLELGHEARERIALLAVDAGTPTPAALGAFAQADQEDELADWLAAAADDGAAALAPELVAAGLGRADLEPVLAGLEPAAAAAAVTVLARVRAAVALAGEVADSAARVSDVVGALRGYARLDQAPVTETDVHAGIDAALRVLRPRLAPGVTVVRAFDPALPAITAHAAELNEVWAVLLDNAARAVGAAGTITVTTHARAGAITVEVADDGPGIAPAIRDRVFDPFFTTRAVGEGAGLGLDVARRIVAGRHHGELRLLEPAPGRSGARVEVVLPAATPAGAG